jgi:hypothetical protein
MCIEAKVEKINLLQGRRGKFFDLGKWGAEGAGSQSVPNRNTIQK